MSFDENENTPEIIDMTNQQTGTTQPNEVVAMNQAVEQMQTEMVNKSIPPTSASTHQPNNKQKGKACKLLYNLLSPKQLLIMIALALVFGMASGVAFYGIQAVFTPAQDPTIQETIAPDKNVTIGATDIIETPNENTVVTDISTLVANAMPSLVSITNLTVQDVESTDSTQHYEYTNKGSGVIVGENDLELIIVTNNHVVMGNKILTITFVDNTTAEAVVKGSDAGVDIAVLAVKKSNVSSNTIQSIKISVIGNSDKLVVGEPAIAIGNAMGYGQSVTSGIVSALRRNISGFDIPLLQTDAAINPGNSGGALLNIHGEVIGINTAKMIGTDVDNMGYAIPISDIKEMIREMMNRETREKVDEAHRGLLGILCTNVDKSTSDLYNIPIGAYIKEVTSDKAADKAGIYKGSVIVKFDGNAISSMTALTDIIAYYAAGETVELIIAVPNQYGEYEEKQVAVTLEGNNP